MGSDPLMLWEAAFDNSVEKLFGNPTKGGFGGTVWKSSDRQCMWLYDCVCTAFETFT